jgi:hypothetical protein
VRIRVFPGLIATDRAKAFCFVPISFAEPVANSAQIAGVLMFRLAVASSFLTFLWWFFRRFGVWSHAYNTCRFSYRSSCSQFWPLGLRQQWTRHAAGGGDARQG